MQRLSFFPRMAVFGLLFIFIACSSSTSSGSPDSSGDEGSTGGNDAVTCTVTFDSQGGSAVASLTVVKGATMSEPGSPTYAGYSFAGWYAESTCATAWNFASDAIMGDRTLYAKWTATTGSGEISILPYEPVIVSIACDATVAYGHQVAATASCSAAVDSYDWYIDGAAVTGQKSAVFSGGSALTCGSHTLMVVATKDGIPYSASCRVMVQ